MKVHELQRFMMVPGWTRSTKFLVNFDQLRSGYTLSINYPGKDGSSYVELLKTQKGAIRVFKTLDSLSRVLLRDDDHVDLTISDKRWL